MLIILGAWKLPCALVLLVPRFARLKEWAYAGAFFTYSGAAASHALVGDVPSVWAAPLRFAVITLVAWALRPSECRLASSRPATEPRPIAWIVSILGASVILVPVLLTLPQGPAPF